jgi:hypothetical protein
MREVFPFGLNRILGFNMSLNKPKLMIITSFVEPLILKITQRVAKIHLLVTSGAPE